MSENDANASWQLVGILVLFFRRSYIRNFHSRPERRIDRPKWCLLAVCTYLIEKIFKTSSTRCNGRLGIERASGSDICTYTEHS